MWRWGSQYSPGPCTVKYESISSKALVKFSCSSTRLRTSMPLRVSKFSNVSTIELLRAVELLPSTSNKALVQNSFSLDGGIVSNILRRSFLIGTNKQFYIHQSSKELLIEGHTSISHWRQVASWMRQKTIHAADTSCRNHMFFLLLKKSLNHQNFQGQKLAP